MLALHIIVCGINGNVSITYNCIWNKRNVSITYNCMWNKR